MGSTRPPRAVGVGVALSYRTNPSRPADNHSKAFELSDFSSGESEDFFLPGCALRHTVISSVLFETTTFIKISGNESTLTRRRIPEEWNP